MTIAFSLSGGGAKGDFEVGALQFLFGQGISPDIVCGTSVGAINAAAIAEGRALSDWSPNGSFLVTMMTCT